MEIILKNDIDNYINQYLVLVTETCDIDNVIQYKERILVKIRSISVLPHNEYCINFSYELNENVTSLVFNSDTSISRVFNESGKTTRYLIADWDFIFNRLKSIRANMSTLIHQLKSPLSTDLMEDIPSIYNLESVKYGQLNIINKLTVLIESSNIN